MILYLHGFRSSPQSFKSRILAAELASRGLSGCWHCPQLPASPAAAMQLAQALVSTVCGTASDPAKSVVLVGSSLGGFYATWLAEQVGCRAVLLNPVVHAARDLATQVGSQRGFHDDTVFEFTPCYVDELRQAEAQIQTLTDPSRYFLLAATGDEVLDWREMQARYAGCRQYIIEGSDHGISDFPRYLPDVLQFLLPETMKQGDDCG